MGAAGVRRWAGVAALLAVWSGCHGPASGPSEAAVGPPAGEPAAATVYLVRHAEKEAEAGLDPPLTAEGAARARALAELLAGAPIGSVVATEFLRTQQTVAPLAERLGLEVEVVVAAAGDALVARLRAGAPGSGALVAGHSNTVPALIAALGVEEAVEIPEDRYGDLFVVRLEEGRTTLERRRFGD
ncbi:MAG TPA: histidine phosphatase family protein [Thermoanaerobaculia bacterium]|nr:histidine phosphatase family protein [Thermoanaerobaculia bacterium]